MRMSASSTNTGSSHAASSTEEIRLEARKWLADNWSPGMDRSHWLDMVIDRGFAVPTWPTEWHGLGLSADQGRAIATEFAAVRAPGSKVTCAPATRAGSGRSNNGSMRTRPVNQPAGPALDGIDPARTISMLRSFDAQYHTCNRNG